MRLPRGSVISGHVFDENGEPMPGAMVRVMMYRYAQGNRQLVPAGNGQTDDRGEYRDLGAESRRILRERGQPEPELILGPRRAGRAARRPGRPPVSFLLRARSGARGQGAGRERRRCHTG